MHQLHSQSLRLRVTFRSIRANSREVQGWQRRWRVCSIVWFPDSLRLVSAGGQLKVWCFLLQMYCKFGWGVLLCACIVQIVSTLDSEFVQGELLFTAARAELVAIRCCWRRLIVHLLISHLDLSSATDISPALRRLISRLKSR